MKKILRLIPMIVLILGLVIVPVRARGFDFGDFSGDSDFGGGGWDSGGSDWGSSWDDDDDYSYSGHHSSGSSSGSDIEAFIFVIIFLVIIVGPSLLKSGKKSGKSTNNGPYIQPTSTASLKSVASYSGVDPSFSPTEFKEKLANLYVRFQNDWQAKNISELRPYMSDAMFAQMDRQLDTYRQRFETNHIDRIAVLGVELLGWKQENGYDIMIAKLNTRIVDYVMDDRTGKVIRGSNTKEKFMTYEWTMARTTGVVTSRSTGTTSQTCPYCGAHVDINHSTVCEYCLSVLTTDTFDWVVTNIRALSQQTR
ncbi:TIM44-like domain-containing protein [Ruminococcus sp.]|uniref:TIM44-like domain-containing protein n=1 Tax=Ruminococcus sp. TaxID=41978 RepID=UPI0025DA21E1|nr:TIM44-like domain-containing protein [Ruminococcus sp.]MCR4638203.1 Tim44 domain-containing protein [Ruminococcus sp.]